MTEMTTLTPCFAVFEYEIAFDHESRSAARFGGRFRVRSEDEREVPGDNLGLVAHCLPFRCAEIRHPEADEWRRGASVVRTGTDSRRADDHCRVTFTTGGAE